MLLVFLVAQVFAAEMNLKERELPARSSECELCHISRKDQFISNKVSTTSEHKEIVEIHGKKKLECNQCHDKADHNYLKKPATFQDSSPVCRRCHVEQYRAFLNGLHGKATGSWTAEKRIRHNCIDCHNQHNVKFKPMESHPGPVIRGH